MTDTNFSKTANNIDVDTGKVIDNFMNVVPAVEEVVASVIEPNIKLGNSGGKILFTCEDGVVDFIKELAKDKSNGLPNKMTGVIMKYLTEGIERDFCRTWDKTPSSLKKSVTPQATYTPKARPLSKKEKNELIAKCDYSFYEKDVELGKLTREEATALMFEAIDKKKELEEDGFVISKKKTVGVKRFDAAAEVNKNYDGNKDYHFIYKVNDYEIVVPNLPEYFDDRVNTSNRIRTFETQLNKCKILEETLKYNAQLKEVVNSAFSNSLDEWLESNNQITIHLVKSSVIGQQKPRYICYEGIDKKTGKQSLLVLEASSGMNGGVVREIYEDYDSKTTRK